MKRKIILVMTIFILTACTNKTVDSSAIQNNISKTSVSNNQTQVSNQTKTRNYNFAEDNKAHNLQRQIIHSKAFELEKLIEQLEHVQESAVVITGNTAIVSLKLADNLNDNKIIEVKVKVNELIKNNDKGIIHVAVSTSKDLFEKIIESPDSEHQEDINRDLMFKTNPTI